MLLFFAGHGSRVKAPETIIAPEGQIEVICPVEYSDAGEEGHGIADYVLGWILGEIADKGAKIVRCCRLSARLFAERSPLQIVILDCCHSGPSFAAALDLLLKLYCRRYGP